MLFFSKAASLAVEWLTVSPPICELPNEVLETILVRCRTHELYNLALVNRRISAVAIRALYNQIPALDARRTLECLTTICFYQHVAPLVQSLTVHFWSSSIDKTFSKSEFARHMLKHGTRRVFQVREAFQDRISLFATALKLMSNLAHLELYLQDGDSPDRNTRRLFSNTIFQLRSLRTTLPLDAGMVEFLRTQPYLEEVHFTQGSETLDGGDLLAEELLPNLTNFGWSRHVPLNLVRRMVECRPVGKVVVTIDPKTPNILDLIGIGRSSLEIKEARFNFMAALPFEHLSTIGRSFPFLEELVLSLTTLTKELIINLTNALMYFQSVRRVTVTNSAPCDETFILEVKPIFKEWFSQTNSLLYITLPQCGLGIVRRSRFKLVGGAQSKAEMEVACLR